MRLAIVLLLALAPALARAVEDPDTEVARRHFEKGREFYDAQQYRAALNEFLLARRVKPAPGLDFNVARCFDRLEEYPSAIEYYERYAATHPADVAEVRARIAVLKERVRRAQPTAPPMEPAPPLLQLSPEPAPRPPTAAAPPAADESAARRRRTGIALGVVGGLLLVGGAVAIGLVFGLREEPHSPYDLGPFTSTR